MKRCRNCHEKLGTPERIENHTDVGIFLKVYRCSECGWMKAELTWDPERSRTVFHSFLVSDKDDPIDVL